MNHRITLLGAIERTRMHAAVLTRGMGLEIMPVEVRKTPYDGNRHDTKAGTEIQTDLAELNGKVAEVLDHGFLQKNKDNSMRVVRKSRVRLYLQAPPKPALAPPSVMVKAPEPAAPLAAPPATVAVVLETTAPEPAAQPEPAARPPIPTPESAGASVGTANEVHTAKQQIEAHGGTSSASPSLAEWKTVAESLTILHQQGGLDAAALNAMLAAVFTDASPQCLVPQMGEVATPFYEAVTGVPGGCVVAVLRVGIELPREGGINRVAMPLVRLGPKQESS